MTGSRRGRVGTRESIRVLHVDDDPEFVDLAETFLQRQAADLDVTTATSASEGLEVLAEQRIDCVVSDFDMPGRNGIEFLEAVRDAHPDVPFLLFTGKGSEEIASEAVSAGVTDYLQKSTGTDQYALLANRIQNVVDRERSRRALEEHNRRLETLVQNLPGMVYRCVNTPDWPMEYVGGECEALTGYSADSFEAGDVVWGKDVLHPDDQQRAWEVVQDALDAREPFELTYRIHTNDGDEKYVWERGRGVYEDGEVRALEGFITDITDQRQYERELEQTNARLEALFENSPDMINVHDADGVILDANSRFCEELGYARDDVVGLCVWDIDTEATESGVRELRHQTDVGDKKRFETTFERADGSTFPVEVHLSRLDMDGEERFIIISRDV